MVRRDRCFEWMDQLAEGKLLKEAEYEQLIMGQSPEISDYLYQKADAVRRRIYGTDVYVRGLIEISNYCRNHCYYCGIRCSNTSVQRYRLSEEQIKECCRNGYALGFRTFVLQSGEDVGISPETMGRLIGDLRSAYPDCAITLSLGEYEKTVYKLWKDAGADRYLLRHETADVKHYRMLHPESMSFAHRIHCLETLKDLGYQVGAGMMIGSPGQTPGHLAKDLCFLQNFQPQMVGIGPFLPAAHTPFSNKKAGTMDQTLFLIGLTRLILPHALIPATTALASIDPKGRERGIYAGANVCMPNLSPLPVRKHYALYDNKVGIGTEGAEGLQELKDRMDRIGYRVVVGRGDPR